jgi:hypothetical protein
MEDRMVSPRVIVVHITPNSPEKIAFDLMERVAFIEWKRIGRNQEYLTKTDRKYLLDTYAECLEAAKGLRDFAGSFPALESQERSVPTNAFAA